MRKFVRTAPLIILGAVILLRGTSAAVMAGTGYVVAPEIDPAIEIGVVGLLTGAVLVIRARNNR